MEETNGTGTNNTTNKTVPKADEADNKQNDQVNKTTSSKKSKTEMEILFPEIEIDGFKIKPWSLGKLTKINPHLEAIFKSLDEKGIKLSIESLENNLKDIYFAAVPQLISIMAISLDKTEQELEEISIPQAIRLIYLIFKQNEESIKNVFSLLQMTVT